LLPGHIGGSRLGVSLALGDTPREREEH
jgi:hypothetical protein